MSIQITAQVTYNSVLGHIIQQYRLSRGLGQLQVATVLGISQSGYSKIEQGSTMTSALQVHTIEIALGLRSGQIMADVNQGISSLTARGVMVVQAKETSKAELLAGLGIMAGILAIASATMK